MVYDVKYECSFNSQENFKFQKYPNCIYSFLSLRKKGYFFTPVFVPWLFKALTQ